jgi:hypothetical protein
MPQGMVKPVDTVLQFALQTVKKGKRQQKIMVLVVCYKSLSYMIFSDTSEIEVNKEICNQ